jgi:Zn-finger nucleic acid-binding protein
MNRGMYATPQCPECRADLELGARGKLDAWACPAGHGAGFTLSELHERAQEDELARLWEGAKEANAGAHACPMCDRQMVSVTVGIDADEALDDQQDTADTGRVTLDVCRDDQFIWFGPRELDELPQDLPEPKPSAAEAAHIERITTAYERELVEAYQDDSALGRFAARVEQRHPGFVRFLDRVVYRDALDESHAV